MKLLNKCIGIFLSIALVITVTPLFGNEVHAAENPAKIFTIEDLYSINSNMDGDYILMNDLDLSEATSNGGDWDFMGNGWEPIGSGGVYGDTAFTGTFDGNGYCISGLNIKVDKNLPEGVGNNVYFGLFSNNTGTIKNVCVSGTIDIETEKNTLEEKIYCGSVAAYNSGEIVNCTSYVEHKAKVQGYINHDNTGSKSIIKDICYIGGISGCSDSGSISNCSNNADMSVTASGRYTRYVDSYDTSDGYHNFNNTGYGMVDVFLGGIAGESSNNINASYSKGKITGESNGEIYSYVNGKTTTTFSKETTEIVNNMFIGGVSGNIKSGSILNCYSIGDVIIKRNTEDKLWNALYSKSSGIASCEVDSSDYSIVNCYSAGNIDNGTGYAIGGNASKCFYLSGSASTQTGASALTTGHMKLQTVFSGFDFDNTWLIDKESDYNYPQIKGNRQDNKNIETIKWVTKPAKTTYFTTDDINVEGGAIRVYYKDGSTEEIDITEGMLREYDLATEGSQTVTVNYRDFELTYDIEVSVKPELSSLTLLSEPTNKTFVKGTEFDFSGCKVAAEYADGSREEIDIIASKTEGGNINILGEQTITYSLDNMSVEFTVTVIPVEVVSLEVTKQPNQIRYVEGKTVSLEGLEVTANYNSGASKVISDYSHSELPTEIGKHDVVLSYSGQSTTVEIEIVEKSAVSIEIKSEPDKTEYVVGEKLDCSGMVVEATYDNDDVLEISDYTVGKLPSEVGFGKVEISYQNQKAYVTVCMSEKVMTGISIKSLPEKVKYLEDEDFDAAGMVVVAEYNDNSTVEVNDYQILNKSSITSKAGERTVTVSYDGYTAKFQVQVVSKVVTSLEITPPTKVDYLVGEEFDPAGMVVKANFNNGKSGIVNDYQLSGFGDEEETNIVTVSYGGKTRDFIVTIHSPAEEYVVTKEASCTETGEKTLYCANCGEAVRTEEIGEKGHSWGEWISIKSPSCEDKGSKYRVCSECFAEDTSDVDANGHEWEESASIDQKPTCTVDGSESVHCKNCDAVKDVHVLPAKGHSETEKIVKATTEEDGSITTSCTVCGEIISTQTIRKISTVEVLNDEVVYTGKAVECELYIIDTANHRLANGEDYDVVFSENVNKGNVKAIVTLKGNYDGTFIKTFKITARDINDLGLTFDEQNQVYSGSAKTPQVVIDGLVQNKDYTVDYFDNVNVGQAKVSINGIGNYTGNVSKSFNIVKANQPLKVTATTKTVKASAVKRKAQVVSPIYVSGNKGTKSYKKVSGSSKLSISSSTGKVTVKKKTRKGTYSIKVTVYSAATSNYNSASKTVTVKVVVK